MTVADVPDVVRVQEPGAVLSLAGVFPQELYPFPREEVRRRWLQEVADPGIECAVVLVQGAVAGFAAARGAEFLHFGIAVEHWGTGVAETAHDATLERMRSRGVQQAWLRVFTGNGRGRRFYEELGWQPTGEHTFSDFPPHPELLRYGRVLSGAARIGLCQTSR